MADIKCAFIVQRPQYKGETSRLALTHALAYQTVEVLLEDGETVTPALCFVGEGVLGFTKGQKAMDVYGITSSESHIKNCLLVDLDVYMFKEDCERYGVSVDQLPDADDMGGEKKINIVPFADIQKLMEEAKHVLFF